MLFSPRCIGNAGARKSHRLILLLSVDCLPPYVHPSGACLLEQSKRFSIWIEHFTRWTHTPTLHALGCLFMPWAVYSCLGLSIGKEFLARVSGFRRSWVDPRIVGVVAIIRCLAKVRKPEWISYSYQVGLMKFASEYEGQQTDSERLDRMVAALRS